MTPSNVNRTRNRTGLAVLFALLLALQFHLFGALLSALATFALCNSLIRVLSRRLSPRLSAAVALLCTLLVVAASAVAAVVALEDNWLRGGGVSGLLDLLADTLEHLRSSLPSWLSDRVPQSVQDMQNATSHWLRANAADVKHWGSSALHAAAHVILGIIIGLLGAFETIPPMNTAWAEEVRQSSSRLAAAFADIVGAQVRISVANTVLSAIFLLAVLPLTGVRLPLTSTLIALTFVAGLLPIVGNLVSNAAMILVALTVSVPAALAAVAFLVVIHKLEYFLNAHFVGERTSVPAAVLVAAMLVLEAIFGLMGLVAAPIYCAWTFRQFELAGKSKAR